MDFVSVDLVGPFETTTKGNQYALTVICMLTNFIIYIPMLDKSADTVVNRYQKEVYFIDSEEVKQFCNLEFLKDRTDF